MHKKNTDGKIVVVLSHLLMISFTRLENFISYIMNKIFKADVMAIHTPRRALKQHTLASFGLFRPAEISQELKP